MPGPEDLNDSLNVFEQQPGLNQLYTQICFCFPVANAPSYQAIISTLKNGLERLSKSFPWVAGQIVNEGGQLLFHGDFDWAGVPIANYMMRVYGARPWRFTSADYKTAVEKHARSEHRLAGSIVEAFWDTALAPSMREHGQAFAEEGLSEELLGDLAR